MDPYRAAGEAVKETCIRVAQQAFEQASISGLCADGALEAAIGAIRMVDVAAVIDTVTLRDRG